MSASTEQTNPQDEQNNEKTQRDLEALQNRKAKARSEKIDQVLQKQLSMQILMAKRGTTVVSRSESMPRAPSGSMGSDSGSPGSGSIMDKCYSADDVSVSSLASMNTSSGSLLAPNDSVNSALMIDKISTALNFARIAVDCDTREDYPNAILNYKDTLAILENEILNVGDAVTQDKMLNLIRVYASRVEQLEQAIPSLAGLIKVQNPYLHSDTTDFIEEQINSSIPEGPPANPQLRPFWLMRIFLRTIQMGGYLTPSIFVPKSVWYQVGARFASLESKITNTENVVESLLKLKEISLEDQEAVSRELELFVMLLGTVQNSLAKTLTFIPEYKDEKDKDPKKEKGALNAIKRVGEKMAKNVGAVVRGREKLDDVSSYVGLLQDVCEQSQFLEKWLTYYSTKDMSHPNVQRLKRISEFFHIVFCNFVMRDLNWLIERYLKRNKENFSRINSK
mmetsp:Transcript_23943/g.33574  ORF Transcript_23943/g.33574 Transcript_23943/m.33574 type:complete len:450 (+) Transcript_23943:113-1462(+)